MIPPEFTKPVIRTGDRSCLTGLCNGSCRRLLNGLIRTVPALPRLCPRSQPLPAALWKSLYWQKQDSSSSLLVVYFYNITKLHPCQRYFCTAIITIYWLIVLNYHKNLDKLRILYYNINVWCSDVYCGQADLPLRQGMSCVSPC